jgi:hypothetical protein
MSRVKFAPRNPVLEVLIATVWPAGQVTRLSRPSWNFVTAVPV